MSSEQLLHSTPESEAYDLPVDATGFTPDDEVRFRASALGTVAEGLARADALAASQSSEQVPVTPERHRQIADVGLRLVRFRRAEASGTTDPLNDEFARAA